MPGRSLWGTSIKDRLLAKGSSVLTMIKPVRPRLQLQGTAEDVSGFLLYEMVLCRASDGQMLCVNRGNRIEQNVRQPC